MATGREWNDFLKDGVKFVEHRPGCIMAKAKSLID
jgi:hypothetical protein